MFREKINNRFQQEGIPFTEEQLEKLEKFYELIVEWNGKFNLTRIVSEEDFIEKHIIDSLSALSEIADHAAVLDIGAGAGFPSIPLKIMKPSLPMTMVDSVGKKINFLQQVIQSLELKNISAVHVRAEDYAELERESFDIVVSRAVAPLPILLEYCLPFIRVGGNCIFYKAQTPEFQEELKLAKNAFLVLKGNVIKTVEYSLGGSKRILLFVSKQSVTDKKYPRKKNLPRTKPL